MPVEYRRIQRSRRVLRPIYFSAIANRDYTFCPILLLVSVRFGDILIEDRPKKGRGVMSLGGLKKNGSIFNFLKSGVAGSNPVCITLLLGSTQ